MIYIELGIKEIVEILQSLPEYKCPACGNNSFTILSFDGGKKPAVRDSIDVEWKTFDFGGCNFVPSKSHITVPTIQVICKRCGHISQHSYFALCELYESMKNGSAK